MVPNSYPGEFIVLEGIDKAGKDTQLYFIEKYFRKNGINFRSFKEPTDKSSYAKKIKQILNKKEKFPGSKEFQKLMILDRKWDLKNQIIPNLKKGTNVILVRYQISTHFYGIASGVRKKFLEENSKNFIEPDLIIVLKIPAKEAIRRQKLEKENPQYFEKFKFLQKVANYYNKADKYFKNVVFINGKKKPKEVFKDIKNILDKFFKI